MDRPIPDPRREGESEQEPESIECPYCSRSTQATKDKDRPSITRYRCIAHGIVSARIDLGDFHWRGDITRGPKHH